MFIIDQKPTDSDDKFIKFMARVFGRLAKLMREDVIGAEQYKKCLENFDYFFACSMLEASRLHLAGTDVSAQYSAEQLALEVFMLGYNTGGHLSEDEIREIDQKLESGDIYGYRTHCGCHRIG